MSNDPNTSKDQVVKTKSNQTRSVQTLFRVTMRQQINHIAIADNKAGIIIGINTLIIGVVMTILGSGVAFKGSELLSQEQLTIPFGILMVMCLVSAIFSVMAAKPKIIKTVSDIPPIKQSRLFFGYINDHTQEEYLDEMFSILGSNEDIHKNLIIDIHNQGQILTKKYIRLHWAYTFFMWGLIGSVVAFLLIWMLA
ncbi:MAG: hypothetical protein DHS20C17_33520 [Cyclobacteriaceae bacterium]|nr:MAG: hypothetical protein DHS20C17_33520 [Cyclobacteriaceae bacterium]